MRTEHRCHVYQDNVNTDIIFPGKYTYTLRQPEDIAAHALEDLDPGFAGRVAEGDVIVAGRNWGCGSSREQAVTTLKYNGVRMIIAESFGGLYFRNCINQGIHPLVIPDLYRHLQTGDSIQVDLAESRLWFGEMAFELPRLSPSVQAILDAGGLVPMLRRRFAEGGAA